MESSLCKILNLIKKTGDRFIVLDSQKDMAFAVMNLEDYEKLMRPTGSVIGLSESGMDDLETVLKEQENNDISSSVKEWESLKEEDDFLSENQESLPLESKAEEKTGKPDDQYYFEPVEA